MIKDIIESNEAVTANAREIAALKEHFPSCFHSDGSFDIERFKEFLSDKVDVTSEGYELKFLGKNYARLLASEDTTTVIQPDEEHNSKPENVNSENIYISADNLDALKHLLKSYAGAVKCIYIDPPYNTGKDDFAYNDKFDFSIEELSEKLSINEEQAERILDLTKRGSASHSAWLMFMYPRLLLARDLLSKDGVIFISIDENEVTNLRLTCDELYGEDNYIGTIVWKNVTDNNPTNIATEHEYILCYSKNKERVSPIWKTSIVDIKDKVLQKEAELLSEIEDEEMLQEQYTLWYSTVKSQLGKLDGYKFIDRNGVYAGSRSVHNPGKNGYFYDVIHPITGKPCTPPLMGYRFPEETMKKMIADGRILYGDDENKIIEIKQYLHDYEDKLASVIELDGRSGANIIRQLFDNKNVFKNPKTPAILKEFIPFVMNDDDIIVDFFAGSSTTAQAIMELSTVSKNNYKYILIQLPEPTKKDSEASLFGFSTIDQVGQERIIRAAKKIKEDHPDTTADLGFKHYTLVEPSKDTLDKMETFNPEMITFNNLVNEFGVPTVLTTWLVRDGYGFNAKCKEIDFNGYTGYWCDKHLYLINEGITQEQIAEIVEKLENDTTFNPENIVLFGYSFNWARTEELNINIKRLKDTDRNLRINFDVRY